MNEVFVLDHEFLFKNNIYEIGTISIEHSYDVSGGECRGEFVISGEYRTHEVSINKEDFSFRVPFNNDVRSNINLDSVEMEITDFTYAFEDDVLNVHVEYLISGEQALIEFAEETDLDDFLNNNQVEVVDLSERAKEVVDSEPEIEVEEIVQPVVTPEPEPIEVPEPLTNRDIPEPVTITTPVEERPGPVSEINQNDIIQSINSEENFVTYHVHTVTAADTLETISNAYNININDLKKLNNFDDLILNMKLIIPDETD